MQGMGNYPEELGKHRFLAPPAAPSPHRPQPRASDSVVLVVGQESDFEDQDPALGVGLAGSLSMRLWLKQGWWEAKI